MAALRDLGINRATESVSCCRTVAVLISFYAITGIGAIAVQLNPFCTEAELSYLLQDSACRWVIAFDKALPVLDEVRSTLPVETVVAVRLGPSDRTLPVGDVWFDDWLASVRAPGDPADLNPVETVAVYFSGYTGGTTDELPKGRC